MPTRKQLKEQVMKRRCAMDYKVADRWNALIQSMRLRVLIYMKRCDDRADILDILDLQMCKSPTMNRKDERVCPTCGNHVQRHDRYCRMCGQRLMEVVFDGE